MSPTLHTSTLSIAPVSHELINKVQSRAHITKKILSKD